MNWEIELRHERSKLDRLEKKKRGLETELIVSQARIKRLQAKIDHERRMKDKIDNAVRLYG